MALRGRAEAEWRSAEALARLEGAGGDSDGALEDQVEQLAAQVAALVARISELEDGDS
jgi:cell division protein FtsB